MQNKKKMMVLLGALPLFCGCSTEMDLWDLNEAEQVTFTACDFEYDKTRTNLDITEAGAVFTWGERDTVGIFPDEGAQAYFPMVSGAGTKKAAFTGGGWALKPSSTYAAYYPFRSGTTVTPDAVPISYLGQKQTGNASTTHLGAYDYMAAVATTPTDGKVNFEFKHLGALVQLKVKMPAAGMLRKVTLVCDDSVFVSKGLLDLKAETPAILPTEKSDIFEVSLDQVTTTESDLTATIYFMLPPTDLSGKTVTLKALDTYGTTHTLSLEGMNFQAGKAYQWGGELEKYPDLTRVYHVETPGTLSRLVGEDNKYVITEMKVTGNLNGTDLRLIREMAGRSLNGSATNGMLMKLDLQDARIVEGGEAYCNDGVCYSKDDEIGRRLFSGTILMDIKLPKSTVLIGDFAFSNCTGLKTVSLPNGVKSIGMSAFADCKILENIQLPENLERIDGSAFYACVSLKEVAFSNKLAVLGISAFEGCEALEKVAFSEGLVSIGQNAFIRCVSLKEAILPESLKTIDNGAFNGCKSLGKVRLPSQLETIKDRTFFACGSLTEIEIPESVRSIEGDAFNGCTALKKVNIPKGLTAISPYCFGSCSSLIEIEIPESVTYIGEGAFKDCSSLERVVIPFGVEKIEGQAFYSCANLRYLTIPGNLVVPTGLYTYVFGSPIVHTTIWEGSAVIQQAVLSSLIGGTLVLPKTLQVIREKNLKTRFNVIYCYATTPPTVLSDNALSPECKVYVPDASVDAYKAANVWSQGQILPLSEAE